MVRWSAFLVAAVLAGTFLAGCLGGEDKQGAAPTTSRARPEGLPSHFRPEALPEPILLCHNNTTCNQEMTPDKDRQGNEVTIAVNPTNPKNIVGGAKDYYPPDAGECVWDGIYVTHDGGATPYQDRSFDGSPWRALSDPTSFKPNYASQFWCTTDPVAYFSTKGTLYYLLMAYQADRVTGSKTGQETIPRHPLGEGALNDWAFNRAVQIVAVSDDGGKSFHTFTPTLDGSYPVGFHDKGWIAASNDGTVHVLWAMFTGFFTLNNVYMRSTDNAKTFPPNQAEILGGAGAGPSGQGSFVDVGPGKEVYATWEGGGGIQFRRSTDGGETWDPAKRVQPVTKRSMPGLSPRDRRGGFTAMATDRFTDSPNAGAIYVVWQDGSKSDASDVLFSASYDKGVTWSSPIVLNDDYREDGTLEPNNWQIFPTISVSPLGVVDVSWMDSRLGGTAELKPNNGGTASKVGQKHERLDQYYVYSLDGGRNWSKNFRVRDADDQGWDPQVCHHQNGMIFLGDYNGISSSWGAAHPVWPDTRSLTACDVYTAIVQRPIFPSGMGEEKKTELRARLLKDSLVDPTHPFLDR